MLREVYSVEVVGGFLSSDRLFFILLLAHALKNLLAIAPLPGRDPAYETTDMAKRKNKKNAREAKAAAPDTPAPPAPTDGLSASERLRPWLLGATVALFVVPPLLPTESSGRSGEMLPVAMMAIILAAVWAASRIGKTGLRPRLQATDWAVAALIVLHTAASLSAARHGHARPAINMLWVWIGMGLGYFLLRQLLATAREARAVAVVMIALAVVLSGYGLWQYAYEFPQLRAEYAKDADAMLRSNDMWYPPGSPQRAQFDNRLGSREPLATFALTNSLAGYLAPWLVVTAGIALAAGWKRRRLFLAAGLSGILMAACLILTKSRSGYVATGLGLVLVAFYCNKYRARIPWRWLLVGALLAAALGGLALAVGGLDAEVFSEASKSLGYRMQYWRSTARMIAERPSFGCGPGQFQGAYTLYKLPQASEEIAEPHNFLLEVWATAGTPAALALLAVLACFAWSFFKRSNSPLIKSLGRAKLPLSRESRPAQQELRPPGPGTKDATAWVLGGGVAGLLGAWPLGVIAAIPPSPAVLLVGAPLGILAAVFLYDWINSPTNNTIKPLAGFAIIALLVNLSAAGGIGFAGVAGSFWMLLALALFRESDHDRRPPRPLLAPTVATLLAILGVMCYVSGYSPVLNSQSHVQAALNDPAHAREHLQAAAVADPLWAQPWRQLASLSFDAWRRGRNLMDLRHFERYMATALELDAASSSTWQMSGDHYLEAYEYTERATDLQHAVAAFRQAVELYPADATLRGKLALVLRMAGKGQESAKEAQTAEKLDALTPHIDQKMPESLRRRLMQTPE